MARGYTRVNWKGVEGQDTRKSQIPIIIMIIITIVVIIIIIVITIIIVEIGTGIAQT